MICTHQPYANIIEYSQDIAEDISHLYYDGFISVMKDVAKEADRILKSKAVCAFMIGDIREKGYVRLLGMDTVNIFIETGFKLK